MDLRESVLSKCKDKILIDIIETDVFGMQKSHSMR